MTNAAPDTGEALAVASTFNRAGQILSENRSRPDGVTSIGYTYNSAGQRTAQSSWGPDETSTVTYAYTGAGRLASALQGDSLTTFGYDGLGRGLTTTTDTSYGSEATTAVWDGMSVVQQTSDISGRATLLRDALGQVALQSTTPGDTSAAAAWSLQDRLGSTVAQTTTTGRITDLASYSDFGIPTFDSTGFAATTGFTGELSDATTGLNSYFSRTYDPFNATWLTADTYRGTLANPASQHRYGYVEGNPATMVDQLGFAAAKGSGVHAPSASIHTADGWDRAIAADPNVQTPSDSGSNHVSDRHPPTTWDPPGCGTLSFNPCAVPTPIGYGDSKNLAIHLSCSNMRVGMDAANVAFNQACAPILMEEAMKSQAPWQQEYAKAWTPWLEMGRTGSAVAQATAPLIGGLAGSTLGWVGGVKVPATATKPLAGTAPVSPSFAVKPNGEIIIIPKGAVGPTPTRSDGFQYQGGTGGGFNLSDKVTGVRIMASHSHPKYPQPTGYVNYNNGVPQPVNPFTGGTVGPADPYWHWSFE